MFFKLVENIFKMIEQEALEATELGDFFEILKKFKITDTHVKYDLPYSTVYLDWTTTQQWLEILENL